MCSERIAEKLRPVIVHSALSGVTDGLEALLAAAMAGSHAAALERIDRRHRDLAQALAIAPSMQFVGFMDELGRMADAIAEDPRTRRPHARSRHGDGGTVGHLAGGRRS